MNKIIMNVAIVLLVLLLAVTGCTSRSEPGGLTTPAQTPSPSAQVAPPLAPVNVAANAVSPNTVNVQWLDNSNNEDGFRIYRGNSLVGAVGANVQSYQDTGLQQGTTYQYAVKAYNQAGESPASLCSVTTPAPPSAASNLTAGTVSRSSMQLEWADNSDNEQGFRIYRGNSLVGTVGANTKTFQDTGLQPATTYQYTVIAYNQVGESPHCSNAFKTLNPAITVRLDRIGVYDNGEPPFREIVGPGGEVYVGIIVTDGNTVVEKRFPAGEGQFYQLYDNEIVDVGATIFSVDEVGDYLRIAAIGYECDGGPAEALIYKALGVVAEGYLSGGAATLLEMTDFSLGNILAKLFGAEDDWLGSYENAWGSDSNWGIGRYTDIACEEKDGTLGLRLWFTIESPR